MKWRLTACIYAWAALIVCAVGPVPAQEVDMADDPAWAALDVGAQTVGDEAMTMALGRLDTALRVGLEIEGEQTGVGLLDMTTGRIAMLRADTQIYAASVPKIAILLAYFQTHPQAADSLDDDTRRELGLMIKRSNNEMAAKYSKLIGLETIADVLTSPTYKLYDPMHGGGLWVGKHYGKSDERLRDPLAGESHAATVRQLLRYYLMLEQGRLVSPTASKTMRGVFESPQLEHLQSKFVLGLAGRDAQIIRKSGTWSDWYSDTAVVTAEGRRYILVVLTHTPANPDHDPPRAIGNEYLVALSRCIDDWAIAGFEGEAPIAPAPEAPKQPETN
jgi:beta-lactamase class A